VSDHRGGNQPSLSEQVMAVERAAVNLRGAVDILRTHVKAGKRDPALLPIKESFLADLEAAARTMKWVERNEARIKGAVND
jgi:hypothetical protein